MSDWKETAEYKLLKYTRSIIIEKQWAGDFEDYISTFNFKDDVFMPVKENIYDHLRRRLYPQMIDLSLQCEKDRELQNE